MSQDNNNKNDKEFSFIQEQIASKKKSKLQRKLRSVAWTIVLASIFGIVAGVSFCLSEPVISKVLGKTTDRKTVEFPTTTPEEEQNTLTPIPSVTGSADVQETDEDKVDSTPEPIVVEKIIRADITDLTNIYSDLRAIANEVSASIVTVTSVSDDVDWLFNNQYEATKTTTGLVVANNEEDILILVSLDKIKDAKNIVVTFPDSFKIKARLQNYDSDLNLAMIAISLQAIPEYHLSYIKPATLGESYSLLVGSPVMALGCPNGYVGSMDIGIITSKSGSVYITDNKIELFNTDIDFNENSDGVIVNLYGEVIGIITNVLKDNQNQDVNAVIGITRIKKIIESLVNNTNRIYFGIKGADMTDAALSKAEVANGICVTEVEADSPALAAGLQSGDIIISVDGNKIVSVNTFYNLLLVNEPKTSVKVKIRRSTKNSYKDLDLDVILEKKEG